METPQEPPCPTCGGRGEITIDDLRVRKCNCVWRRAMRHHLGDELWEAPSIKSSPLYERKKLPDGSIKVITDLTASNLYIESSSWAGLLPHLRWALGNKGTTFHFRILTDELIKRCFVGGMSYRTKRLAERESEESFNTLADMVGDVCDLVILKLGWLGYKNISAAGAIYEALLIRENLRLPTWLVTTESHSWEGSYSHNTEVQSYIMRRKFKNIRIDSNLRDEDDDKFDAPGMSVVTDEEPPVEEMALVPPPTEEPVVVAEPPNSLLDAPSKKFKPFKQQKPKYGKKNDGGGLPEL